MSSSPPETADARDAYAAAAVLGCSVDLIGQCAECRTYVHRYGRGGNPLCSRCRSRLEALRGGAGRVGAQAAS